MRSRILFGATFLFVVPAVSAQNGNGSLPSSLVKPNYELASRWTAQKVSKLVFDTAVAPQWFESGDRFWYSYETNQGKRWTLVDPVRRNKAPLFDNARMAAELSKLTRTPFDAQHLPITEVKLIRGDAALQLEVELPRDTEVPGAKAPDTKDAGAGTKKKVFVEFNMATGSLTLMDAPLTPKKPRWASVSPDGRSVVFVRGHNLYMLNADNYSKALKDEEDKAIVETQLTTDGEEHFSYGRRLTDEDRREMKIDATNEKSKRLPSMTIVWSTDSRKLATVRQDQRKVSDLWVINSLSNPRPTLESYRYVMPGEDQAPQSELLIIDRDSRSKLVIQADSFKDQLIQIHARPLPAIDRQRDKTEPQWLSDTSDKLYFNRTSRDMKRVDICVADTATGQVRVLIEERLNTYIDTKPLRLIGNGQELVHWSERDGWGHYYLYDGTGRLKNQITQGEFATDEIFGIDERSRTMLFQANGREKGEDPYYTHTYRIGLDGSGLKLLNPGSASHAASFSDSRKFFVNNLSRVDSAPEAVLMDDAGNRVLPLETTDVAALLEAGFRYPEPFQVKADDGITDLYGVMYKPFDFDAKKKYPIIAFVYPGPQTESVTKTFSPKNQNVGLSQMGFIVIEVGNRGGHPQRSNWYHNYGYGDLRDYGLADKKAAIEQLARRHGFIDAAKVGIYGHSGGGFMSTAAMLVYPDFFKVAVASSGNHENNVYNRSWSEKHHGVKEVTDKDGNTKFEYAIEKNSELAANLKGRLLLTTGDIDDNVHMAGTLRMADALIKANKRFDFFMFPGKRHAYGDATDYFFWMKADYFARYLLGESDESADLIELQREKAQTGNGPRR